MQTTKVLDCLPVYTEMKKPLYTPLRDFIFNFRFTEECTQEYSYRFCLYTKPVWI